MQTQSFEEIYRAAFPFWETLPQQERELLCRASTAVSFLRGATIHDASVCTGVILVRTGCLRVYLLSEEGRELTLYRIFPGELCILSASCVTDSITFDVLVDAEENSECYILGGMTFAQVAARNKDMKIFALEATVRRFSDVVWLMEQVLFMSLDKRLAIFLLDESAKTGSDTLRLTQEQIARYMGSAREVVSRMLKYFSSEGLVQVVRGGVRILDRSRLRALCA